MMRLSSLVVFSGVCFVSFGAQAALPAGVPAPTFHVDAWAADTLVTEKGEDGRDYVTRWNDASGGSRYATSDANKCPWLGVENGLPYVDFGVCSKMSEVQKGVNGYLKWSWTDYSVREVFLVLADYDEENRSQFLLSNNGSYDFHRGADGALFIGQYASANVRNGVIEVDGEPQPYTYSLPSGFHFIHLRTTGNVSANRFASDRDNYTVGGLRLREVIVYDTVLTDAQAQAISTYLKGKWGGAVFVAGEPAEYGAPSPGYGATTDLEPDAAYTFACPAAYTNAAGTLGATCLGYRLALTNGTVITGADLSTSIVYSASAAFSTLTWLWKPYLAVDQRTIVDGRQVAETRHWTDADGNVTLTVPATPAGCEFVGWFGAGITEENRYNTTLTLTRTAPENAYAVFRTVGSESSLYFVDDAGVDDIQTRDGRSPETAWKTLGFAISSAEAGSMVVLTKGVHEFKASVILDKALTIRGDGENWETVLDGKVSDNGKLTVSVDGALFHDFTFYRVGGPYANVMTLNLSGNSVLSNVVFSSTQLNTPQNGRLPIKASKGLITHCWITNNLAIGNAGVVLEGTAAIEDCYIAGNKQRAKNGDGRGVVEIRSANASMRNCTIVDNQLAVNEDAAVCVAADATVQNNLIWDNVNFNSGLPANVVDTAATTKWVGNCSLPCVGTAENGNTGLNPMLQEDRRHFLAASPCNHGAYGDTATAVDLEGTVRRQGGARPSVGAFEYAAPPTLQLSIEPSDAFVRDPDTITLVATAEGPGSDALFYNWDLKGDGSVISHEVSPVLSGIGIYRPTLEVTNAAGARATAVLAQELCIHAAGVTSLFVNPTTGSDENDGLSPERPRKNLTSAILQTMLVEGDEIVIAAGTHVLTEQTNISKPIVVRGAGRNDETVLDGNFKEYRFNLTAAGACLHSLTLRHMGSRDSYVYAIDMSADATVSNVVIRDTNEGQTLGNGRILVKASAGLLTHCWITNNVSKGNVGLELSGTACVVNSYFAKNKRDGAQSNSSAVLYLNGSNARAVNCTIVDNIVQLCPAVSALSGSRVQNCIIWNNIDDTTSQPANLSVSSDSDARYQCGNCTTPTNKVCGAGCIADDPMLAADRMHFKSTSPCRGAAIAEYAPAADLDGNPRGDHPSIGAFEYVDSGSLEVSLGRSATFARLPDGITLTNSVTGSYQEPLSYAWDFYGTGETNATTSCATITALGVFRPTLTVTDANGKSASASFEESLTVHAEGSTTYYVNDETGDDANFGFDPASPMKTLAHALASDLVVDGDVVELMKGVHRPDRALGVAKSIVIRGAGKPEETVLDGQIRTTRFEVSASGALLCNVTLYRFGGLHDSTLALSMSGNSVVSNVIVRGCNEGCAETDGNGRDVIVLNNGLLTHCAITNNRAWGNVGVTLNGPARMENCLIADNTNLKKDVYGSGVIEFAKTTAAGTPRIVNCTIVSNRTTETAALRIYRGSSAALPIFANSIVRDNIDRMGGTNLNWQIMAAGVTSESLTSNVTASCLWPTNGISGVGNTDLDPRFAPRLAYRLTVASPCRNAGDNSFVTATTDLDGASRRFGRRVDMGCYELQQGAGLSVIVR